MRFIHMIRDPRDVIGSYMKQVWAPSDPALIVQIFKAQFADYEALRLTLPSSSILELRLEDLSSNKTEVLETLSTFLGVENKFNGDLFLNERTNTGAYGDGLGQATMRLIETDLADWMARHRYLP